MMITKKFNIGDEVFYGWITENEIDGVYAPIAKGKIVKIIEEVDKFTYILENGEYYVDSLNNSSNFMGKTTDYKSLGELLNTMGLCKGSDKE